MTAKEIIEELNTLIQSGQIPEDAEVLWEHEYHGMIPVDSLTATPMILAPNKNYYEASQVYVVGKEVITVRIS